MKYIQKACSNSTLPDDAEQRETSGSKDFSNEVLQALFDGMSSGTARIVIEQEIDRHFQEDYDIDLVESQGRYYLARIVRHDGTTLQRLLVDKQAGTVRLVGR